MATGIPSREGQNASSRYVWLASLKPGKPYSCWPGGYVGNICHIQQKEVLLYNIWLRRLSIIKSNICKSVLKVQVGGEEVWKLLVGILRWLPPFKVRESVYMVNLFIYV